MIRKQNLLKNKITIAVLGRSGSGKGTQAEFILRRLRQKGVRRLETGKFLREIAKTATATGAIAKTLLRQGKIFPSWLVALTWLNKLIYQKYILDNLVYDGAPRRLWEAALLDEVIAWHGRSLVICVYVDVGKDEATRRLLKRGRLDDTSSPIKNRMAFFAKEVLPTIRYYQKRRRLIRVNGEQAPELVWRDIDAALAKRFGRLWPSP